MKLRYIGPFDEVEVPYTEDNLPKSVTFRRGEVVEVPDELANGVPGDDGHPGYGGLLEQTDNYESAESPTPSRRKT